jgi:hopanoid C-3 methylase
VEPLELEVLATLAGADHHSVVVDMILERKPVDFFIRRENPDVFCVTGYITNVPGMINYCRSAKRINPEIVTIAGGVHCEVCPEDLNDTSIDFRVVRNATLVFPQLLSYLVDGKSFPRGVLRKDEQLIPSKLPPFDFYFPISNRSFTHHYRHKYFYIFHEKVALIKTAFGCPFMCNFCFCREITKGKYAERPLPEIITELRGIKEKNIYIVDDDFLCDKIRVKDFIDANRSAGLDKNYLLYGRADFIANNPGIIEDFRRIGLRTVIVGIESFFDNELASYHKNISAITNDEAMKVLNTNKIDCYATIIVSPEWGKEEFTYCRNKIRELKIHYVNLQPLTPLPGMGNTIVEGDLIVPYSDYAKWDLAHVTLRPAKMSVADFYRNILRLYNSILFQPRFMLDYIKKYNLIMLYKMITGSFMVWRQYRLKIKEAKHNA